MKSILTQNSKLKKTSKIMGVRVFNFGIPAYRSVTGKTTCPFAGGCVKYCYAQKGAYIWSNVTPAFEKRLQLTRQDNFIEVMTNEVKSKRCDFVRVHDSGDYYSPKYLRNWYDVAKNCPDTKFYSYTNSVKMVKDSDMPDNFDFTFSDGGKQVHLIEDGDKHSRVFKSYDSMRADGYVDASDNDLMSTKWYNKTNKVGLIYH